MQSNYTLDSSALLAYLRNEPEAEEMNRIFEQAEQKKVQLSMSVVNYGEILYIIEREQTSQDMALVQIYLQNMGVKICHVDDKIATVAASFKVKGKISYADCFALANAKVRNEKLLTKDREFAQFEKDVSIRWLGEKKSL